MSRTMIATCWNVRSFDPPVGGNGTSARRAKLRQFELFVAEREANDPRPCPEDAVRSSYAVSDDFGVARPSERQDASVEVDRPVDIGDRESDDVDARDRQRDLVSARTRVEQTIAAAMAQATMPRCQRGSPHDVTA